MKKVLSIVMVMMMTLALAACGKEEAKLRIGMEMTYPPFEYFDTDGTTPLGVDVELGKAIADKLGMDVEYVDTAWDGIFAGLDKGDYDCIISAVTINPERLLDYDFSDPYIQNYQCIVALKDGEFKPASPDELAGKIVAYQDETTSDYFMADYAEAAGFTFDAREYAQVMDCFSDLELGRVDAIAVDSTVASSYLGEGSVYEVTWTQDSDPEEFAVCVKKGDAELQQKINEALKELKEDGTLDKIIEKYF